MSEERNTANKPSRRESLGRSLGLGRLSPFWRRLLAIAVFVALAVVAVVVVPAAIATRPTFLARYPQLEPRVQTWQTSVHANVPCQGCHVPPGFAPQAAYGARMLGELYLSLVPSSRTPNLLPAPTNAACSQCHIELRAVSPSGDLSIPHRAHVEVLGLACVKCHEFLVHEKSPDGAHHPRMVACLTCHDGRQAKNSCSTCHTQKAAPASHRAKDWIVVHPTKQHEIDCVKCHGWTAHWCEECHGRRPRSHDPKWRTNHSVAVKARRNCEVCHVADFCTRCHGKVPALNLNPALRLVR